MKIVVYESDLADSKALHESTVTLARAAFTVEVSIATPPLVTTAAGIPASPRVARTDSIRRGRHDDRRNGGWAWCRHRPLRTR